MARRDHRRIDLLLTDIVLTGDMDGYDLAAVLGGRYPALKVLFMSGYTEQGPTPRRPQESGFRLLQKPFRKSDLLNAVRETPNGVGGG